ncbi:Dyp-type peroxidase [Streptomyces sp. NPDC127190]|uniref:Dyp-type peroxidase n=1 Tax=unclassified Streptomyces TaxID=2593676 RepID=UPI0036269C91
MPVNLDNTAPLSWKNATGDDATMLQHLQPNILKGHVRDRLHILILGFADASAGRAFLSGLVPLMKSARTALEEADAHNQHGTNGTPYVGVGLSALGYQALGLDHVEFHDDVFNKGMKDPESVARLSDPETTQWQQEYQEKNIHAIVLVGDHDDDPADARLAEVKALLTDSITVIAEETGQTQRDDAGRGIEQFGYVDGRSLPLFLAEDLDAERDTMDGTDVWNPFLSLGRVLVPDPGAPDPGTDFGSYFVLRKLEQNVRAFKAAEEELANTLNLTNDDRARAGAMFVGRFRDGTPLTLQPKAIGHTPVMNNFTYDQDADAHKCPFQAHIRKTNPRGSGQFEDPEGEKRHLMARRGQTYGDRTPGVDPESGVGLLFMAFNSEIDQQFQFVQQLWVNNPGFPGHGQAPEPGVDPVIGQGSRPPQSWPLVWGEDGTQETPAPTQAVTMKGGEYFFMPSLPFLSSL